MNISGQAASIGFAQGPALILKSQAVKVSTKRSLGPKAESSLLKEALARAAQDLRQMKEAADQNKKSQGAEILEAHLTLLEDPEALDQSLAQIEQGKSAEIAYHSVIEEFRQMFLQVEDELIRQRALDLQDIRDRVIFYLQSPQEKYPDLHLAIPAVVIARDLTPSQILSMDKSKLLGFITVEGGGTSHTAILARSLEIPAVVGMNESILQIPEGQEICLNGETGQIISNPSNEDKALFLKMKAVFEEKINENLKLRGQASATRDGVQIRLAANISGPQDLESLKKNDAEAVGLYRTEFLFLDRELAPSEEEQFEIYHQVFQGLKGKPILIRTLDIGGDKKAAYLNMKPEENPFLGVRALRLCFLRPEIFKTQIRALLRAGHGADWGLMFPMVSQLEEVIQAKAFVTEAQSELRKEGKTFSENFKIGIMIEIPSAAWMMKTLAPHVDFVSIGTNDLLQYTCAADRLNPELKSVYNPFNVGFLHQIRHILQTCKEMHVHSGICGSLSHHPDLMAFFVGCGVNELSMTSQHVLTTRASIRKLDFKKCQTLVEDVLACGTTAEVKSKFQNFSKT